MRMIRGLLLCTGLCGAVLCAAPARAQIDSREGIALQNQMAELRQELQVLQQNQQGGGQTQSNLGSAQNDAPSYRSGGGGGGVNGDTVAQLVVRVGALEEQNRTLQGRVDDLTNQLQRNHDDLTKQIGDLAFKIGQAPAGAAAVAARRSRRRRGSPLHRRRLPGRRTARRNWPCARAMRRSPGGIMRRRLRLRARPWPRTARA